MFQRQRVMVSVSASIYEFLKLRVDFRGQDVKMSRKYENANKIILFKDVTYVVFVECTLIDMFRNNFNYWVQFIGYYSTISKELNAQFSFPLLNNTLDKIRVIILCTFYVVVWILIFFINLIVLVLFLKKFQFWKCEFIYAISQLPEI